MEDSQQIYCQGETLVTLYVLIHIPSDTKVYASSSAQILSFIRNISELIPSFVLPYCLYYIPFVRGKKNKYIHVDVPILKENIKIMGIFSQEISFDRDAFRNNSYYARSFEALQRSLINNELNQTEAENSQLNLDIENREKKEDPFAVSRTSTMVERD